MEKKEIRVQYSGLIIFAAQLISIATGLAFTLLLTRNLTHEEFGTWTLMFDLVAYFNIFSGLFPFWAVRFMARNKEGVTKTVLASNFAMSGISMIAYLVLLLPLTAALGVNPALILTYAVASVYILNTHLIAASESILRAKKPEKLGIGLLVSEVSKVSLAYSLSFVLGQIFLGAMVGFLIGGVLQMAYYLKLLSADLRQAIHFSFVREWAKGSTATIFGLIGTQIANFVFILLFVYGGHGVARADYQAATSFAAVIGYASALALALYPKLIAESCFDEVEASLRLMLMFALPMTILTIVMSPSLLTILNVSYQPASTVLIVLAADALVMVLLVFYQFVYIGTEKLDEEATIHLGELVRSKIFRVQAMPYLQAAITLPPVLYVLTNLVTESSQLALIIAVIILFAHIIELALAYVWTIHACRVTFPWVSVSKYIFASAIAGSVLFLLPHPTTVLLTLVLLTAGVGLFAAITLLIDKYARELVKAVLKELPRIARDNSAKTTRPKPSNRFSRLAAFLRFSESPTTGCWFPNNGQGLTLSALGLYGRFAVRLRL